MHVIAGQGGGLQGGAGARVQGLPAAGGEERRGDGRDADAQRGLRIVSGRTESHVMLVDLRPKGLTGKEAEAVLGAAHMTCNKNGIPNDPQKPMVTSGIRLGTPAMTTRGFREEQARLTANLIADVLDKPHDEANIAAVRAKVAALTQGLPGLSLTAPKLVAMRLRCPPGGAEPPSGGSAAAGRRWPHALPLLQPRRNPGRRDARVRRGRRGAPAAPLPALRQALHHLRARRDRAAVGGQEGRHARRVRRSPSCAPR